MEPAALQATRCLQPPATVASGPWTRPQVPDESTPSATRRARPQSLQMHVPHCLRDGSPAAQRGRGPTKPPAAGRRAAAAACAPPRPWRWRRRGAAGHTLHRPPGADGTHPRESASTAPAMDGQRALAGAVAPAQSGAGGGETLATPLPPRRQCQPDGRRRPTAQWVLILCSRANAQFL